MQKSIKLILGGVIFLSVAACSSFTPATASYVDPNAVNNLTTDFTMTDLQLVAGSMADSLITSGRLNSCKTYTVSNVANKTDQYIDTSAITQSIVNKLGNSSAVKSRYVISAQEMQNQTDELDRQNQSGLYNANTTAKTGNMRGAQCRIDGFVNSINSANTQTKTTLVQYQYNMKLIDVETGEMVWSNEKPLSKMKQY